MTEKKKLCLAILSCFLLSALVIGSCLAYYIHSDVKNNTLTVGSNTSEIVSTFNKNNLPKNITTGTVVPIKISVLNTGSPSYVRIFMAVSDSLIADKMTIDYNENDFTKVEIDGEYWWQYNSVVGTDETTNALCTSITFNDDLTAEEGENLEIIIYEETVQARGFDTPAEAFKSIKGE